MSPEELEFAADVIKRTFEPEFSDEIFFSRPCRGSVLSDAELNLRYFAEKLRETVG
jgi:hypothetical protein